MENGLWNGLGAHPSSAFFFQNVPASEPYNSDICLDCDISAHIFLGGGDYFRNNSRLLVGVMQGNTFA